MEDPGNAGSSHRPWEAAGSLPAPQAVSSQGRASPGPSASPLADELAPVAQPLVVFDPSIQECSFLCYLMTIAGDSPFP